MKPLVIRLKEAKEFLIAAVNATIKEKDLPCYLIEPIIAEVHNQVSAAATKEYESAKQLEKNANEGENADDGS